jgi:hypothetical protein
MSSVEAYYKTLLTQRGTAERERPLYRDWSERTVSSYEPCLKSPLSIQRIGATKKRECIDPTTSSFIATRSRAIALDFSRSTEYDEALATNQASMPTFRDYQSVSSQKLQHHGCCDQLSSKKLPRPIETRVKTAAI